MSELIININTSIIKYLFSLYDLWDGGYSYDGVELDKNSEIWNYNYDNLIKKGGKCTV